MKLILALPAASLLLSGALNLEKRSPNHAPAFSELPAAAAAVEPAQKKMWAKTDLLYKGESLLLHFETPHAPYLGVIDPDGHFFYVVYPAENSMGKLRPLVPGARFAAMNTLRINAATLKADPYTWGFLENKRVFTKSGTYRFLLGDDLHTDDEDFVTVLKIRYRHVSRPVQVAVAFAGE